MFSHISTASNGLGVGKRSIFNESAKGFTQQIMNRCEEDEFEHQNTKKFYNSISQIDEDLNFLTEEFDVIS